MVWQLKSDRSIADKLGECMVHVINTRYQDLKKMDIIVPVPPGDSKRPYNQAALLAKYVSTHTSRISECLIVIESNGSGGTYHQVNWAIEQGCKVFGN